MSELSAIEIERVVGFLGYGNPASDVWFIGVEEGIAGMGESDVHHNLKVRGQWSSIMDLVDAHLTLVKDGAIYDIAHRSTFTQVWTWIAKFARALGGANDWDDLNPAKTYVRERLGRSDGDIFMSYAMPIPESGLHTREWTDFLKRNGANQDQALARRRTALRALIARHQPKLIICHGTSRTRAYQSLLPAVKWGVLPSVEHIIAASAPYGGRFFITPFFGNGQMSKSIANAFVDVLREGGVQGEAHTTSPVADAAIQLAPLRPARHALTQPVKLKTLRDAEYGDGTDPKGTVQLLHDLGELGFDDDAFYRLHHKREVRIRETIGGFGKYCLDTKRFQKGGTNYFVHWRLFSLRV